MRDVRVLMMAIALFARPPAQAADITFSYVSEPGDFIGQGLSASYNDADGSWSFVRNFDNGVSIDFDHSDPGIYWELDFAAPDEAFITVGSYPNAVRFPFQDPGLPGLEVTGEGRGCSTLTGSFDVTAVTYDWYCEPVWFAAAFEQHCESATPALTGTVEFDAGLGPLSPALGEVFVTYANRVYEFQPPSPWPWRGIPILECSGTVPAATEVARDLVVRDNGDIEVFNGTFEPVLSSFDGAAGGWQHHTFADWGVLNNESQGGIAAFGRFVFVTDSLVGDNGIIRFDSSAGYSAERFGSVAYIDLNIGQDGILYALRPDETTVDRYNPATMASMGTVTLANTVRALAANAAGEILGASWDGFVYRFAPDGSQLYQREIPGRSFVDIDVRQGISVYVASRNEMMYTSLSDPYSSIGFAVGTEDMPVFVALVAVDPSESVVFMDGFESGDSSVWSSG